MPSNGGLLRSHHSKLVLIQRVADAAWIAVGYAIVFFAYEHRPWSDHDTVAVAAGMLGFLFFAEASGVYQPWRGVPLHQEVLRVWGAWVGLIAGLLFVAFVWKESATYSRVVIVSWFVAAPLLVGLWRVILRLSLQEARRKGRNMRRAAIVGLTPMAEHIARKTKESPWFGIELVGFYDDRNPERLHEVPEDLGSLVGTFQDAVDQARAGQIDIVYLALPLKAETRVADILRRLSDTTANVYIVPDFFVFDLLHGRWSSFDGIPLVSVHETPFFGVDGWLKRLEDVVLGSLFLSIAALPMMAIAAAIKLTSKGPVFFQQRRYGLNGEVIDVLKFRTMTVAEDGADVKQATKNDKRITKVGAILRRTSLDELPQLIHVVTGSMSLVGPRPHAVAHNEDYRKRIQGYMLRHKVKPGLTGWAQVNGWRGETDSLYKMEKRIEHDLEYIRRWGILFDLKIIFLTIFGTKVHKNAY